MDKSIEFLNRGVMDEMNAIHQYLYFHFVMEDAGYRRLAGLFRKKALAEMGHLGKLVERVLKIGGEPAMEPSWEVEHGRDVEWSLKLAMDMERKAVQFYNEAARQCGGFGDSASRKLFEELVVDEEDHWQEYKNELDLLKKMGASYLAFLAGE